ncbi:hypothetical protein L3Q82_002066 [Scortum barcoo]|uniref:Uncharacterized protein n=1 Tax=Scortum barcoo TaxID=214431 RepID=A0ACB8W2N4_9TELE|nr:hypothetical protein L3Q82_002066 [Scortum barcoo]
MAPGHLPLGRRSMIDFVVVSSDLRPYVLDTRVKRGAELSTDHHLVVSWLRWQRRKLDRPGRPKRIVRVCWERLAEPSVREVFNSHLRKSFSQIPREAGDIESEWTMFSASIVDACSSKLWTQGLWCLSWWQSSNPVVDTGSQASKPQPGRSWRQKLGSGRSSVRPWRRTIGRPRRDSGKQTGKPSIRRLRRGKQYSANTVYSAGGELLTSTEDIVGRWKKYFEDLLNPTDLPSNEEAEDGDSEVDSSITQAEVTEVVRKLLGGKAPGVDEIRPEYLKSLDVVGLSWLTRLCNIAWRLGTVPLEWQTGVVVPLFKKGLKRGTGECVPTTEGSHFSASPGRSNARVLERRIRPIVDPRIQEEQCGFRPGRGTVDQLYTLRRVLRGFMGVCPTSPHVLCGSGEGIRPCPSWYSVGSAQREYGVRGPLLRAVLFGLCIRPEQELGSHCRQ